jgi:hypothetical protein
MRAQAALLRQSFGKPLAAAGHKARDRRRHADRLRNLGLDQPRTKGVSPACCGRICPPQTCPTSAGVGRNGRNTAAALPSLQSPRRLTGRPTFPLASARRPSGPSTATWAEPGDRAGCKQRPIAVAQHHAFHGRVEHGSSRMRAAMGKPSSRSTIPLRVGASDGSPLAFPSYLPRISRATVSASMPRTRFPLQRMTGHTDL